MPAPITLVKQYRTPFEPLTLPCGCRIVRELFGEETAAIVAQDGSTPPRRFEMERERCVILNAPNPYGARP